MLRASRQNAAPLAAVAVAAVLAGCAASGERDSTAMRTTPIATDCFNVSLARDFRYLDDHNLIVYAPARQAYHLELTQACFGLRNVTRLALRSRMDRMCGFAGDSVIIDGAFSERCSVLSVRRLDAAGTDALIAQFEGVGDRGDGFEVEVVKAPEDTDNAGEEDRENNAAEGRDARGGATESGGNDSADGGRVR